MVAAIKVRRGQAQLPATAVVHYEGAFAERLDRCLERSGKVVDLKAIDQPKTIEAASVEGPPEWAGPIRRRFEERPHEMALG
jgi:hypothetical protein